MAALLALWVILRLFSYGDRARLYSLLSGFLEGFLEPIWPVALLVVGALALLMRRRSRRAPAAEPAVIAPDVHLRAEPPGKLSIVISESRGALVKDFVVERSPDEERRILARFDELAGQSVAFAGTPVDRRRTDGSSREEIERMQHQIYSLGLSLGEVLLGGVSEARDRLFDLPGDHLLLRIQPELSDIPWELLVPRSGGQFLWQRYAVSRQLRDDTGAVQARLAQEGPLRMLILANLEAGREGRALPSAEAEAAELLDLSAARPHLLRALRKTPATAADLRGLLAEGFDVIHFAGHSGDGTGETGWVLASGETVDPAELLSEAGSVPTLVFANACGSGGKVRGVASRRGDAARSLMRSGIAAHVGTLWELDDAGSAEFARVFYRALLAGSTLAAAVNAARGALLGARPFTWANYVLHGDPALTLAVNTPGTKRSRLSDD